MQREFWSDIGRTSNGGGTCGILLGTPTAVTSRNRTALRNNPNSRHHDGVTLLDGILLGLISFVEDSPASLFRWQAIAKGTLMSAGYGQRFATLSTSSSQDSCWSRTYQAYYQPMLDGSLETFSGTWPRSGTMRSGNVYRQQPLVTRISDGASSLLPTPRAGDSQHQSKNATMERVQRKKTGDVQLSSLLRWQATGGLLNPQFVEAVMGFPLGHTSLDALETQSCHKSPNGSADELQQRKEIEF